MLIIGLIIIIIIKAKKLTTFFSRSPQNTGHNYKKLLNEPLRPCRTLCIHPAAVTITFGGKDQVWGQLTPVPT